MHLPFRGRASWVGGRRWRLSRRSQSLKRASHYFPFVSWSEKRLCSFFRSVVLFFWILLDMLVAKREPTTLMHIRWVHLGGHFGRKDDRFTVSLTVSSLFKRVFLVTKRTLFFLGELVIWMLHTGKARQSWAWQTFFLPLVSCRWSFVNVGGWLTYGNLALDSCAQFLAVAEHGLIPSRARSVGHLLRRAGHQSVWALPVRRRLLVVMLGLGWSVQVLLLLLYLPLRPLDSRSSFSWGELCGSLSPLEMGEWFTCFSFMGIRGRRRMLSSLNAAAH